MKTFKTRTWKSVLVLASGLAGLAASLPVDDPVPAVRALGAMPNGHPAMPPTFSWIDIFRGPR